MIFHPFNLPLLVLAVFIVVVPDWFMSASVNSAESNANGRAQYLERKYMAVVGDRAYLDAQSFEIMRYLENWLTVYDSQFNEEHLTEGGAWAKRWSPRDRKGSIGSPVLGAYVDISFVRCVGERINDAMLAYLLDVYF